jgi:hypothetical protein
MGYRGKGNVPRAFSLPIFFNLIRKKDVSIARCAPNPASKAQPAGLKLVLETTATWFAGKDAKLFLIPWDNIQALLLKGD